MNFSRQILSLNLFIFASSASFLASGAIVNGNCQSFNLETIPVGTFSQPLTMPMSPMRVTQNYHTSKAEGWCSVDNKQYDASSTSCQGHAILYGHDGLDLHPQGSKAGKNPIYSIQPGLVLVSQSQEIMKGWGETIIIATRTNAYSEEVLTFHYHHLYYDTKAKQTSRTISPCDLVVSGQEIAKEGGTGGWPTHLHLSIKRWKNPAELLDTLQKHPDRIYGKGYVSNNDQLISNFLDPQSLLYDYFNDFVAAKKSSPTLLEYEPYAKFLRNHGWEFGFFNGEFGLYEKVLRREMVRYLKTALEIPSLHSLQSPYLDFPLNDPDFVYLDSLYNYPLPLRIIQKNPTYNQNFEPDSPIDRTHALKMIIAAFYQDEFLQFYNNWVWKAATDAASLLLNKFTDLDPKAWYAPYVYFASLKGLIPVSKTFGTDFKLTRPDLSRWLSLAYQYRHSQSNSFCSTQHCLNGYYCEESSHQCDPIPTCLPTEEEPCPLGGGNAAPINTGSCQFNSCQPGQIETIPCSKGYQQRVCSPDCSWDPWSLCLSTNSADAGSDSTITDSSIKDGATGLDSSVKDSTTTDSVVPDTTVKDSSSQDTFTPPDSSVSQPETGPTCQCTSGSCCNGCNYLPSSQSCLIQTEYHCAGLNPGENAEFRQRETFCTGASATCSGQEKIGNWQTYQDCSTSQLCTHPAGSGPICQEIPAPSCTDQYFSSPSSSSCYSNPSGSGNPTICLEVSPLNGANWQYRFCKAVSSFGNNLTYSLIDLNHTDKYLDSGSLLAGTTCSAWKSLNFSYLGTGTSSGAGLELEIKSPASCSVSACTYRSGMVSLYKKCL